MKLSIPGAFALAVLVSLSIPIAADAAPVPDHQVAQLAGASVLAASPGLPQFTPALVLAQVSPTAQTSAPAVDPAGDDLATLANELVTAITSSNWALVAALVIVILTLALRRWGGQYLPWLNSKWAGVLIPLLGSIAGAVATALVGGAPLTVALLLKAIIVGVLAIGGFSAAKNAGQAAGIIPVAPKPVATTKEAAAVLERAGRGLGPQP